MLKEKTEVLVRMALQSKHLYTMPEAFDLREEYPQCSMPPRAQGICSSSWALAVTGAYEKQVCSLSGGKQRPRISAQWALDCAPRSGGCNGGRV